MKPTRVALAVLGAVFAALAVPTEISRAQEADMTLPMILLHQVLGPGRLVPLSEGSTVRSDAAGRVVLQTRAEDDESGVLQVSVTVAGVSASMRCSPPAWAQTMVRWNTRDIPEGIYPVAVIADDAAGNRLQVQI